MTSRRGSAILLSLALDATVAADAVAAADADHRSGSLRAHRRSSSSVDDETDESDLDVFDTASAEDLSEQAVKILSESFDASNLIPQLPHDAKGTFPVTKDTAGARSENDMDDAAPEKYIVGGYEANTADYPFFAEMRGCNSGDYSCQSSGDDSGGQYDWGRCGAALISDSHILTAGHCVAPEVRGKFDLGGFRIGGGGSEWASASWDDAELHPRYDENGRDMPEFDAAIVTLKSPVAASPAYIDTGNIADQFIDGGFPTFTAIGHGKTSGGISGQPSPSALLEADMFGLDDGYCEEKYGNSYHTYDDSMLCAGQYNDRQDETSTCNGDSGGPLLSMNAGANLQVAGVEGPVLVGVTSWGPSGCAGGVQEPSVFAKAGKMVEWFGPVVCNSYASRRGDRPDWCRVCDGTTLGWCQGVERAATPSNTKITTPLTASSATATTAPAQSTSTTGTAAQTSSTAAAKGNDLVTYEKRCAEERRKEYCSYGSSNPMLAKVCRCGWLADMTGEDGAARRRQKCWSRGVKRTCPHTCRERCNRGT